MPTSPPPPPPYQPAHTPAGRTPDSPATLRRDSVLVGLGVALLATAIVISTLNARKDGSLDWSNYGVGIAATLGLLGVAVGARAVVDDADTSRTLFVWPFAFGAIGAGLMVAVGLDDSDTTTYVAGAVVLVLAAAGYLLAPSAPLALSAVFGTLLVYGQAFTDLADFEVAENNGFITFSLAVLVFVLLVTAIAWFLPPARVAVAIVAGAGAVLAYATLMATVAFAALFTGGFDGAGAPGRNDEFDNDVYVTLAFAAVLVAVWLVAGYLTDHPGFKLLIVAMCAVVVPAAMGVLAVQHPSWWGLGIGVLGGLVLVAVALRGLGSRS